MALIPGSFRAYRDLSVGETINPDVQVGRCEAASTIGMSMYGLVCFLAVDFIKNNIDKIIWTKHSHFHVNQLKNDPNRVYLSEEFKFSDELPL